MLTCKNCGESIKQRVSGKFAHADSNRTHCYTFRGSTEVATPNTEETTMPEPTITDEQRAAYQRITGAPGSLPIPAGVTRDSDVALLLPLLPDELKRAPLPKEDGLYLDKYDDVWRRWEHPDDGMDRLIDKEKPPHGNPDAWKYAPFRKLVEQKEPVTFTGDELYDLWYNTPDGPHAVAAVVAEYINTKVRGDA